MATDSPSAPTAPAAPSPAPKGLLRRLYAWVLHWADTPYGLPALMLLSFAESSFFPIPPDVLLIALCMGAPRKAFRYVGWCAVASVVGGVLGYGIGWGLWEGLQSFFYTYIPGFTEVQFNKVAALYDQYDFWVVFVAAFTPIPYKVITIAAGVFSINLPMFILASAVGRTARFTLVGGAIYFFGPTVKVYLDRYLEWAILAFTVLLVGSFVLLKYLH